MDNATLFQVRKALVQAFLRENGYDGVLLSRMDNFAMATGGKLNQVYRLSDLGACSIFITKTGKAYYVGNNIEETRVMAEELAGFGCEVRAFPWFKGGAADVVRKEFKGALVSDDGSLGENVTGKLAYLRALLTPAELEKYRRLGKLAAEAMVATINMINPGDTEADIGARLAAEGVKRRCFVPVTLVAADERIAQFRHPIPTLAPLLTPNAPEKSVRGYVMVVGCFVREGLVASVTRFKQVGEISPEIPEAFSRICAVDAAVHEATDPNKHRTLSEVFAVCQAAYKKFGFAENEWHNHHQGGPTGYAGRTCKATPGTTFPVLDRSWAKRAGEIAGLDVKFGHAFAWNPSAPGVKSEDTFIMFPDGTKEIVTATPSLPRVDLVALLGRETEVVKSGIAG